MRNLPIYIFIFLSISCARKNNTQLASSVNIKNDSNEKLLDRVQKETFNYFWEGGEPISGAARERIHMDNIYPYHDKDIVTSGGTGFGILATIVAIERGFIKRNEGFDRLSKLTNWLTSAERFHGAWSHWLLPSGKAMPFSKFDDGGDLVETAYLAQGLITASQYFKSGNNEEKELASKMEDLWRGIDWQWYTNGEKVLFWHWSPEYGWKMNFRVRGYNECLIMYILAASSPDHSIDPSVFHEGYMRNGEILSDRIYYGYKTILDHYDTDDKAVGPLFWAHYSYLGLNPHDLKDKYADYWMLNQNHALIHYQHCVTNPNHYKGYSDKCWGLTSSYSITGYAGHCPEEDLGVISPTAALSSFPYTPVESMRFLKFLYEEQDSLLGEYGPYDAFSFDADWNLPRYLAIDQLPIPIMIENYRSGLIWNLFMSSPEIQKGLDKLGFNYKKHS